MPHLEVENLAKYFPIESGLLARILGSRKWVRAVDGVSFAVEKGEVLALVGESGSGKTTTARLIVRLIDPTRGTIKLSGIDITRLKGEALRRLRRRVQIIFQDPYASLNPRMRVGDIIAHPLVVNDMYTWAEAREEALEMLKRVGLTPPGYFFNRYPHQLSGGQRQRVAIARAMVLRPELLVADEAVSMLDVSIRSSILHLLESFRLETGLTILFITHDIAVARLIADRIAVMYMGKIVEIGPSESVIKRPRHPYTLALIESVPSLRRRRKAKIRIGEYVPDLVSPPSGCRFHPRCPFATQKCSSEEPELVEVDKDHYVACHYPLQG